MAAVAAAVATAKRILRIFSPERGSPAAAILEKIG
jgi:hypothetical protein